MFQELEHLADESQNVKKAMHEAKKIIASNSEGAERLAMLHKGAKESIGSAESVDEVASDGFVDELRHVVATYISEAVTAIDIPPIQGSKD
eukprot:SAG31_NODE_17690_length_661_cov_0.976868_1_plen_90_part_10